MNIALWICQVFVAIVFLYSGLHKIRYSERELVAMGQTGVEGLPLATIRFIAVCELLGVCGLILPQLLHVVPLLTPISAVLLGIIMILAGRIHYRRGENRNVATNMVVLILCLFIAWGRLIERGLFERMGA
jgi:uncharacterized membrane protein YphA (DoxX/SURF4 family)